MPLSAIPVVSCTPNATRPTLHTIPPLITLQGTATSKTNSKQPATHFETFPNTFWHSNCYSHIFTRPQIRLTGITYCVFCHVLCAIYRVGYSVRKHHYAVASDSRYDVSCSLPKSEVPLIQPFRTMYRPTGQQLSPRLGNAYNSIHRGRLSMQSGQRSRTHLYVRFCPLCAFLFALNRQDRPVLPLLAPLPFP